MNHPTSNSLTVIEDFLCCPRCEGDLRFASPSITCRQCKGQYQVDGQIPLLFCPNDWEAERIDVTGAMKDFYETTPFPNYDSFDGFGSLIQKARESVFARLLDEQIPFGASILECGCGTGQMSNFLSTGNRTVLGSDMCLNSLRLGQAFKEKNELNRVHFLQMNLFKPAVRKERFDLVICNGVLHHTTDPFGGFQSIARLVKPNGFILIGLYHKWGRIINDVRRVIFGMTRNRLLFLDPRLRRVERGEDVRKKTWFADQYLNPHESKHTIAEVQEWLKKQGFAFIKSIPKPKMFDRFDVNEALFKRTPPGNWLELFAVEFGMMLRPSHEGGFFIVIGRKKA